jgi:hypothetical protein
MYNTQTNNTNPKQNRFTKASILRNQHNHLLFDVVTTRKGVPVYIKEATEFDTAVCIADAYNGVAYNGVTTG